MDHDEETECNRLNFLHVLGLETTCKEAKFFNSLKKKMFSYLLPINAKVTKFATIYRYLEYLQRLAIEVNMPYVNITLDVSAAMSTERVLWNYPAIFNNALIH